jgi:hypothetical protein
MKAKSPKPLKNAHTSNSKKGMGDYYGSVVKNKIGTMREDMLNLSGPASKNTKTPPRSLA